MPRLGLAGVPQFSPPPLKRRFPIKVSVPVDNNSVMSAAIDRQVSVELSSALK
jgi:hypothetical protein